MESTEEKNSNISDKVICIDLTNDDEGFTRGNSKLSFSNSCKDSDTKHMTGTFTPVENSTEGGSKIADKEGTKSLKYQTRFKRKAVEEYCLRSKKLKTASNAATESLKFEGKCQKEVNCLKKEAHAIFLKIQNNVRIQPSSKDLGDSISCETFDVTISEIECYLRIANVHSKSSKLLKETKILSPDTKIGNVSKEYLKSDDKEMYMNDCEAEVVEDSNSENDVKILDETKVSNENSLSKNSVTCKNQEAELRSSEKICATDAPECNSTYEENSSNKLNSSNQTIINESGLTTNHNTKNKYSSCESSKTDKVEKDTSVVFISCLETEEMPCPVTLLDVKVSEGKFVSDTIINNDVKKQLCSYSDICNENNPDTLIANIKNPDLTGEKYKYSNILNPEGFLDDGLQNTSFKCIDNETQSEQLPLNASLSKRNSGNFQNGSMEYELNANDGDERKQCTNVDNNEDNRSTLQTNARTNVEASPCKLGTYALNDQTVPPEWFWLKNKCTSENSIGKSNFDVSNSNSCNMEKAVYKSNSEGTCLPSISHFNQELIENASEEKKRYDQILANKNDLQNFWKQEKCPSCTKGICKHISNSSQKLIESSTSDKLGYSDGMFNNESELNESGHEISNMRKFNNVQDVTNKGSINSYKGILEEKCPNDIEIVHEIDILTSTSTVTNDLGTLAADITDQTKNNRGLPFADRCSELENNPSRSLYKISKSNGFTFSSTVDSNVDKRLNILQDKPINDFKIPQLSEMGFREFPQMRTVSNPKCHSNGNSSQVNYENNETKQYDPRINLTNAGVNSIDLSMEILRKAVDAFKHLPPIFNRESSSLNENSNQYNSTQSCVSFSTDNLKHRNNKDMDEDDISSGISQDSCTVVFENRTEILKYDNEVRKTSVPKELNNSNTISSSTDVPFVSNERNVTAENFPHIRTSTDLHMVKGPDALQDKLTKIINISPSPEKELCTQMQNSNVYNSTENSNFPVSQMQGVNNEMKPSDLNLSVLGTIDINVKDLQNLLDAVRHIKSTSSTGNNTQGKSRELNEKYRPQNCISVSPKNSKHSNANDVMEDFIFPLKNSNCSTVSLDKDERLLKNDNELISAIVQNEFLENIGKESSSNNNARSLCNEWNVNIAGSAFTSRTGDLHAGKRSDSLQNKLSEGAYNCQLSEVQFCDYSRVQNSNLVRNSNRNSSLPTDRTGRLSSDMNKSDSKLNLPIPMTNSNIFSMEELKKILSAVKHLNPIVNTHSNGQDERRELSEKNSTRKCMAISVENSMHSGNEDVKDYTSSLMSLKSRNMSFDKNGKMMRSDTDPVNVAVQKYFLEHGYRGCSSRDALFNTHEKGMNAERHCNSDLQSYPELADSREKYSVYKEMADDISVANSKSDLTKQISDLREKNDYVYKWLCEVDATNESSTGATKSVEFTSESNKIYPQQCHLRSLNYTGIQGEESVTFPKVLTSDLPATALSGCMTPTGTSNSCAMPIFNLSTSEIENIDCSMKADISPPCSKSSSGTSGKGQFSLNNEERISNNFSATGYSEISPSVSLSLGKYSQTGNKETLNTSAKTPKADITGITGKNTSICLVPKQFKTFVGYKIMDTESVLLLMLEWRVEWLGQQLKTDPLPPVYKILKTAVNSYRSFQEYYNTYLPLMLVDTWDRVFISWNYTKTAPSYLCEISSHFVSSQYLKIECQTVVGDHPKGLFPSDGKLSIITIGVDTQESNNKMFGYLTRVITRAFNHATDSKLQSYKHLKDKKKKDLIVHHITIKVAYNVRQYDLTLPIRVQILCNVKTTLKQNDAMIYMEKSPLFKNILSPMNEVQNFELMSCNADSNEVLKNVADITQSISISYPIPSLTTVRYKFDSDRLRTIPLLVENLNTTYACKVLLCERTVKSLNAVADSIRQCKSLKMVILNKGCETENHLVKYLLHKRVASEMKKNVVQDDSHSDNERSSRVRKNVLKKCNVILALIRNSHDELLSDTISNSESIAHLCCIVDEASLCTETDALIPVMHGISKLILIGNPDYDAKTLSSTAKTFQYHKSFFHRVYNMHMASK